jgi:hypothetical protein
MPFDPSTIDVRDHCTRGFRALQATHFPAAHTTDGFITPQVEQLHSPDPAQCQQVVAAGIAAGVTARCLKTSKMAGFESRTRANNPSSNARLGLRHRMSPSTVTLTPRQQSSLRISDAWVTGALSRRRVRCREPQSKFVNSREPECAHSFQRLDCNFRILVFWFPLYIRNQNLGTHT